MNTKLKTILLIDDDPLLNFMSKKIIGRVDAAIKVVGLENGSKALAYLKQNAGNARKLPQLIFLDIGMPVMDGWAFLEQYETLRDTLITQPIVVILTSSLYEADKKRAEQIDAVSTYYVKPLSMEGVAEMIETYFSDK